MIRVTVEGQIREYEKAVTLKEVALEFQHQFPYEILLAKVSGKLQELTEEIQPGTEISFLTAQTKLGMDAYQRSAKLLLLKVLYEVIGEERIGSVTVSYSIADGLFIEASGDFKLDQTLAEKTKEKMLEYVNRDVPIVKKSLPTAKAMERFAQRKMQDKVDLIKYRRVSWVNVYSLDGFEDYFYGPMVYSTGSIRYFDLILYEGGLVLWLPDKTAPDHLELFAPPSKLFQVLHETEEWGKKLDVANVGFLNDQISAGKMNELILVQEALMEKKIGDIADMIASRPHVKFVMIAGPSSSGKTTFSHRLSIQLKAKGMKPHPIEVDNYFIDRKHSPRDENGNYDFEALECIDVKLFNENMLDLLAGKTVELPHFNFISGEREYRGDFMKLGEGDILVIEGIHCLNEKMSYALPVENKFKIYISALTQLNIDDHNRIPTTDGRLIRRMVRDARTRGSSAQATIRMWPTVRRGEERNIFPYQEEADVMFNSALVYELSVLKQYAEPLLFGVPRDSEEFLEANRLLKFLDYFLGISSEDIPKNSIVREFIGGSCFKA